MNSTLLTTEDGLSDGWAEIEGLNDMLGLIDGFVVSDGPLGWKLGLGVEDGF